ncbi:YdaU family protein [Mesorhizobium sp. LjNodule214]|uniref:YdaU family protein n=1 Tax=Mesorhizobium sp. LjNodule214 TaxID=3342252 RepID=UPI003ED02778
MSAAPYMPFFVDAHLADTMHLTTEEQGAYVLLLMAMWRREGKVSNYDPDLARIVKLTLAKWRKMKLRLLPFLLVEETYLTQKRLKIEWEYVSTKRKINTANGKKGGRPSNINNRLAEANGSVSDNPDGSLHNPDPTSKGRVYPFRKSSHQTGSPEPTRSYAELAAEMCKEFRVE